MASAANSELSRDEPAALLPPSVDLSMPRIPATDLQLRYQALARENAKLQDRIAKLEAARITDRNRIKALEKELDSGQNRQLREILNTISDEGADVGPGPSKGRRMRHVNQA